MALVATGQLDLRAANLIKLQLSDSTGRDERLSEGALRIIEDRLRGKMLLYFRDLTQRALDAEGITDNAA